ncbi:MAG: nucleoside monophosphate kinase [bacterium]|nr:nucleoside monophosphate kinase [bacterium]
MKILLIGPQGSGKSTQGKLLAQYLGVPYISTGDILRDIASQDTPEGKQIKQIIELGKLVDDITMRDLVKRRLEQSDCQNGFVIDGYPRSAEQADLFTAHDFKLDKAVYLQVPEEKVVERLMNRGRADDTPELIKVRLENYNNKISNLLDFLEGMKILVKIDDIGSLEDIQQRIRETLKK